LFDHGLIDGFEDMVGCFAEGFAHIDGNVFLYQFAQGQVGREGLIFGWIPANDIVEVAHEQQAEFFELIEAQRAPLSGEQIMCGAVCEAVFDQKGKWAVDAAGLEEGGEV